MIEPSRPITTAMLIAAALAATPLAAAENPAARARLDAPAFLAPPGEPAGAFPKPARPVAEIISPIFDSERARDKAKETEQVFALMKLKPGMTVADIGAGSGYYTVRLAKAVGPQGRVLAQDITPNYLRDLSARIVKLTLRNVTVARGEDHDPRLPRNSVDAAFLIHMYHEIAQPFAHLHNLAAAMKPGGRVGILDADRDTSAHGTPPALLRCELAAAGYREVSFTTLTGGLGYLAVFEAPAPDARKPPGDVRACGVDGKTR